MKTITRNLMAFIPAAVLVLGAVSAWAQETPPPAAEPQNLTTTTLEAKIKTAQENTTLDDATKTKLLELYRQIADQKRLEDEWGQTVQTYEKNVFEAPERIARIEQELLLPPEPLKLDVPRDSTLADIERLATEADAQSTQARTEFTELEKEAAKRTERRRQIPDIRTEAQQRLSTYLKEAESPPPTGEIPEVTEARLALAQKRIEATEMEIRAYAAEAASYDARGRLVTLRLDRATRNVSQFEKVAQAWREQVAAQRLVEARLASVRAREALLETNNAPDEIRALAEQLATETTELADERTGTEGILQKIEFAEKELTAIDAQLLELSSDFNAVQLRVEKAGTSTATGLLLRSQQSNLPDVRKRTRNIRQRRETIAQVQTNQIEADEQRRALADVEVLVLEQIDERASRATVEERETLSKVLRELYRAKRDALDAIRQDYETYVNKLYDLDRRERELVDETNLFSDYISERVLWVRSGSLIDLSDFMKFQPAAGWLLNPNRAMQLPNALTADLRINPFLNVIGVLFALVLFLATGKINQGIKSAAERAQKSTCIVIEPTVIAAIFTILSSFNLSILPAFVGWRLATSFSGTDYTQAIGSAILVTAGCWWCLRLIRGVIRPDGLALAHFGWNEKPTRLIARRLLGLQYFSLPLVFFIAIFENYSELAWRESVGRVLFMALAVVFIVFAHRMLRPKNGSIYEVMNMTSKMMRGQRRRIWWMLGVGGSFALLVAAGLGYFYSALRIGAQVQITIVYAFCLLVIIDIVLRFLLITRRKLLIEQRKKRAEARKAEADSGAPIVKEPEIDISKVDVQTARLIRSVSVIGILFGLWFVWADELPALGIMDKVDLWSYTETTTTESMDPEGKSIISESSVRKHITLGHLAVALFIAMGTFIAGQNLPGLLEMVVLQRLSLAAGERYAIRTILGYVITAVGTMWAFSTMGVGWNRLQWLIAAVGLGLGFGLQEIFANFVSGIIILFERPIRVGDTVTVGDISGTVSKIRIRATWITAFNRRELVVPNKEFVTTQLINWSLSDQLLRIEIPVGIAYGSDTALARKLLYEVADQNALVLRDPKPDVLFQSFGDSSLLFELRVFSPNLESFYRIKDEMHTQIDYAFRENGIEIAFPQRDIHIRSIDAKMPMVRPEEAAD